MKEPKMTVRKATCSPEMMKERIGKRVAAYARVSTDSDEQEKSFASQITYYTDYIKNHPKYVFAGVYSDEGISGTGTKKRDGFNQMMADARLGAFDMIICKSIARFGRNTLDTINACRELRSLNIDVYFEKENIHTIDPTGEVMLTIFSSFAQEESRSIATNVAWGIRSNFKKGIYTLCYNNLIGYKKNSKGKVVIDEEGAKVVRLIYRSLFEGNSIAVIAKMLNEKKIPTPMDNDHWSFGVVSSILTNERYCGDALLQKQYVPDFLTHKCVKNDGVLDQYYVTDGHPAIVSHEVFAYAQNEIESRKNYGQFNKDATGLSGKIVCSECLVYYGRKIAHSNDKYRHEFYRCGRKYENKCTNPDVKTNSLIGGFFIALDSLATERDTWQSFLKQYFEDRGKGDTINFEEYKRPFDKVAFHSLIDIVIIDGKHMHFKFRDGSIRTVMNCGF